MGSNDETSVPLLMVIACLIDADTGSALVCNATKNIGSEYKLLVKNSLSPSTVIWLLQQTSASYLVILFRVIP